MNLTGIYPKNLYHAVKKYNFSQSEINHYLFEYPNSKRVLGSLPYDWIKDVPKNEIPLLVQNIANAFSKFAETISSIHTRDGFFAVRGAKVRLKKFQKQLQKDMQNILNRDDISVNYAGGGAFKHCHKLSIGNFQYALATFLKKENIKKEAFSNFCNVHKQGKCYEPQNSFTLYKNDSHGRWAKPFLSKIAQEDDFDGFILSKFIDSNRKIKFIQGPFERKHIKIKNNDFANRNFIKGVYCDVGGSFFNPQYINDKKIRKTWQGLARRFDETNLLFEKSCKWLDSYIVKELENNVNIFDKNYINYINYQAYHLMLSKKEKRVMKTFITNLAYANKMIKNAEKDGIKADIIQIFNNDLKEAFSYKKEVWYGPDGEYYNKSFAKILGVSNKPSPKEIVTTISEFPIYEIKKRLHS